MNKNEIIKKLRDMAKYPTVTLPRDCEALKAAADLLAQPEQEPVAWMTPTGALYRTEDVDGCFDETHIPLYTTSPQRKPLTDEEIMNLCASEWASHPIEVARVIEAAHGIKGEV